MNVRKKLKRVIAILTCAVLVLGSTVVTQAAGESGIQGNGTSGIYININGYPYTHYAQDSAYGKWAYTPSGCAWFATSRACELTGKQFSTIYSGANWYNNAYAYYGFAHGQEIREKALACYEGHVAVVEKIEGNQAVISEGGYPNSSANGYTIIRKRNISDMGAAGTGGKLLGYVYLSNEPIQVSLTWSNEQCQPSSNSASVRAEADTNISGSFTEAGITVWNEAGQVVATKSENPGVTGKHLNIWYDIAGELGVTLDSGTNYTYKIYTVFNGTRYETGVKSFRTTGQTANAWIQELNINNWTYGEEAQTPVAEAKYGQVTFTYSTEKDGEYTSNRPENAGNYYVKATVAGTEQYTGLEAVKEFQIYKAIPAYEIPEKVTAIYGQTLADVELPEGFVWADTDLKVGDVGEKEFEVSFVPEDLLNYEVINGIEIVVNVEPKDLSGMKLTGIDKNTDLNKYVIKDGENVLVKDKDYKITSTTKGNEVTVSVEFIGNYKGNIKTTYSLKTENEVKKDKIVEKKSEVKAAKTGDVTDLGMWCTLLALAGVVSVATFKKKKEVR